MRRRAPRPLSVALEQLGRRAAPPTLLARVQAVWPEAVGAAIAFEAQPVSERAGTVTIACRSATWASELELLSPDVLAKLNRALGDSPDGPLKALRAKVAEPP
jgi:predicted nucleic acid-binding Zn ribbon protein